MAVTTTNLIAGPATLYVGAFGATEPADSAVNSAPVASTWPDVGGTQGGARLTAEVEYFELTVDQMVDIPERRLTSRNLGIETNLAEPTLVNVKLAFNGGTITASAAYSVYDPDADVAASQPTYSAAILDGWAPRSAGGVVMRRRTIARKVLNFSGVGQEYTKDGQTVLPVRFGIHAVSSAIKPFKIVDQLT